MGDVSSKTVLGVVTYANLEYDEILDVALAVVTRRMSEYVYESSYDRSFAYMGTQIVYTRKDPGVSLLTMYEFGSCKDYGYLETGSFRPETRGSCVEIRLRYVDSDDAGELSGALEISVMEEILERLGGGCLIEEETAYVESVTDRSKYVRIV